MFHASDHAVRVEPTDAHSGAAVLLSDGPWIEPTDLRGLAEEWQVPVTLAAGAATLTLAACQPRAERMSTMDPVQQVNGAKPQMFLSQQAVRPRYDGRESSLVMKELAVQYHFDPNKTMIIVADACQYGLGAVLLQVSNGTRRPVCYASRSLTDTEKR